MTHKVPAFCQWFPLFIFWNNNTDYKHPLSACFRLYRKTIRAFTDTAKAINSCLKGTCFPPIFQITTEVKINLFSTCNHKAISLHYRIVKYLGVSEILFLIVYHDRISIVFFEVLVVCAVCYALNLLSFKRVICINRNQRRLSLFSKAGYILLIIDCGTRENIAQFIRI